MGIIGGIFGIIGDVVGTVTGSIVGLSAYAISETLNLPISIIKSALAQGATTYEEIKEFADI